MLANQIEWYVVITKWYWGNFLDMNKMNFGVFSNTLQLSLSNSNFGNHNTMLDLQAHMIMRKGFGAIWI
jgi:hypothetical protein